MKKYDVISIGMGPAGMAITAMGSAMGLSVLAIEKHKVGGECLNCGCIPSKALLKAGEANYMAHHLEKFGISSQVETKPTNPLQIVRDKVTKINGKKLMKAFEKAELIMSDDGAEIIDRHRVKVDGKTYWGKRIFIAVGTSPLLPPIPGIDDVPLLTNVNMFEQDKIPTHLMIIGGGAIGTEMAQAFARLGSQVTLAHLDAHLIPAGDAEAAVVLETQLISEGIKIYNATQITKLEMRGDTILTHTDKGIFEADKLLMAAGRTPHLADLKLDNVGIKYTKKGITTNRYMQTNIKNIYAVGDCNGRALLSHAAMHQAMLALMHAVSPLPMQMLSINKYPVPWSIFTKPEVAQVGITEKEAKEKGIYHEVVKKDYASYGRTVADGTLEGFIKIVLGKKGKVLGATIAGENASELIHEWTMAIQYKKSMFDIAMMMHSFPTISMLNKMVAEQWMMQMMDNKSLQKLIKIMY